MQPTNLYSYYQSKGKPLPSTVADRFADPDFASAAKRAGYDINSYTINQGNADANQKILQQLLAGGSTTGSTVPTGSTGTNVNTNLNNTQPLGNLIGNTSSTSTPTPSPFDYSSLTPRSTGSIPAYTPPDLDQIKSDYLAKYQTQIDAVKQLYADQINKAKQVGMNQLGQVGAIQAKTGLGGSNIATSQDAGVQQNTQDNISTLNAKETQAINDIINNVESKANADYSLKTDAADKILSNYQKSKLLRDEANKANISGLAEDLYARGIDPATLSQDAWNQIKTKFTDLDPNAVVSSYQQYKQEQDKAKNTADKDRYINIGDGTQVYDTKTGKIIASNEKERNVDPFSGLTPSQSTLFNNIVNNYQKSPLIRASDRTPVLQSAIKGVLENPTNGALQLNLVYSYVQALDTYQSAVREGELGLVNSIDSKVGKLANYVQQINNGQIVRADVAKELANASQALVDTISTAAKSKSDQFNSQAKTLGLGDAWSKYTGGFTSAYNPAKTTSTTSDTGGLKTDW